MPSRFWPATDSPGGCGSMMIATSAAKPSTRPAFLIWVARGFVFLSAAAAAGIGTLAVNGATWCTSDILRLPQARQRTCGLALQAVSSQLLDAIGRVTGA